MSSSAETNLPLESVRLACTELSWRRAEPLTGTAPRVDTWLLLGYNEPWGGKAFDESRLPYPVKDWLAARLQTLPSARLLLIKQAGVPAGDRLPFYISIADPEGGRLHEFNLDRYEDMFSLDLAGIIAGQPIREVHPQPSPLYLVCTNGKRDACCAREGLPLYRALQEQVGNRAWQCTHVGGHRFAANVLVFPEGLIYGRLSPGDAARLTAATDRREILLAHLRGRACYEPVVQAAEGHVRQRENAPQFGRFKLEDTRVLDENQWQVRFKDRDTPAVYQLVVRNNRSTEQEYQSCKGDKQAPSLDYELVDYQILRDLSRPGFG